MNMNAAKRLATQGGYLLVDLTGARRLATEAPRRRVVNLCVSESQWQDAADQSALLDDAQRAERSRAYMIPFTVGFATAVLFGLAIRLLS